MEGMTQTSTFASWLGLMSHDVSYHVTLFQKLKKNTHTSASTSNGESSMEKWIRNVADLVVFTNNFCAV